MRLLNITNRYYIAVSLALILIGNAFLVYRMFDLYDADITKQLLYEKQLLDVQLLTQRHLQRVPTTIGDKISIVPIEKFTSFKVQVRDTAIIDSTAFENRTKYRVLSYEQQIGDDGYRISIRKKLAENKDLFYGISITLLIIGVDIIVSFYLLNWWFSRNIWRPFYSALNILQNFDLRKRERPSFFKGSRVREFRILNEELRKLMERVWHDYTSLKEFTENMSHETQTPLAIIHSRLDLMLQSDGLTREQQEQIKITLDAVSRLSKMNKALILLAKIDNNQFSETQHFNLGKLIRKHVEGLEPFIQAKGLQLTVEIKDDLFARMNPGLADMLFSNLLSNAIRYNKENGVLRVICNEEFLKIENSGQPLTFSTEDIFERFRKGEKHDSVGLGLAIVKKICDYCDCDISYSYQNNLHSMTIQFDSSKVVHEEPIEA